MPQLDHFSFFSQVFWVLFFFTAFYFLNLRHTLPAIASIIKVRKRVLQKSQNALSSPNLIKNSAESSAAFFALPRLVATMHPHGYFAPIERSNLHVDKAVYCKAIASRSAKVCGYEKLPFFMKTAS